MEWPSNSPDLSPIENIWAYLKTPLLRYEHHPKTTAELLERVRVEWAKLQPDFLENYVKSLPKRVAAVITSKGGSIAW